MLAIMRCLPSCDACHHAMLANMRCLPSCDACHHASCDASAEVWRNIKQYPSAHQHKQICVVRVDAPIYFANVDWVRSRITKYAERSSEDKSLEPVRFVVLDLAPVPFIDATGAPRAKMVVLTSSLTGTMRISLLSAAT
jgi:MFS superfamily sulfate permease-like transporter